MKARLRVFLCIGFVALFGAVASPLRAGSLGDWFKKLGDSFAHPQKHPTPAPRNKPGRKEAQTGAISPTPVPGATPEPTVRIASVVKGGGNPKRDLPYAIPVADKPGFVTSPYAPTQGIVDVRGIPSGSEVKDPFTGKSFLAP